MPASRRGSSPLPFYQEGCLTRMVPSDLRYTKDHEWVRVDGDEATVGITAYAADQLGDIVFVELPDVGRALEPVRGVRRRRVGQGRQRPVRPGRAARSSRRTPSLDGQPELVNSDPYGGGWMIRVRVADAGQVDDLLDADAYDALIAAG